MPSSPVGRVNRFEDMGITLRTGRQGWIAVMVAVWLAASTASAAGKETLFVYPPDGWRLAFETQVGKIRFYEYLPPGDTSSSWTEMVSVQVIGGASDKSPTELARNLRTRFTGECAKHAFRGPERFNMGGYLAARLYVECTDPTVKRRPGGTAYRKHEVAAFQIIQGKQDLYIIERAWHGPALGPAAPHGRDDLWGWDAFWHGIEICDPTERDRACFGLGLLSADKATIFVAQIDPVLPYGCDYFRILSILPDTAKATRPTMVVPVKLGIDGFGKLKQHAVLVSDLTAAHEENRPAAVILTMAGRALSGIFPTDAAKAARDATALAQLLAANGVDPARIHQSINTDCPGG